MKRRLSHEFDQEDKSHPDPFSAPHTKLSRVLEADASNVVKVFDSSRPLVQIAPMLHVSHRHFRMFMRQFTTKAQLWTEMVVDTTIKHTNDLDRHLGFSPKERPLVCQIGGSNPETLAAGAEIIQSYGYEEINLNVGCPSSRVVDCGEFGAVLMKKPEHVRSICETMKAKISVPLTVKTRIAVDDLDSLEWCSDYIKTLSESGVRHFIMHARPAWLSKKLTPAQNRSIPPLNYDRVFQLVEKHPDLDFSINGGIETLDEVERLLRVPHPVYTEKSALVGCMIGRATTDKPAFLYDVDRRIYGEKSNPASAYSRYTVIQGYIDYLSDLCKDAEDKSGLPKATKHVFPVLNPCVGLFHSTKGSKLFRQALDTQVRKNATTLGADEILQKVLQLLEEAYPTILHAPFEPEPQPEVSEKQLEDPDNSCQLKGTPSASSETTQTPD